MAQATNTNTNTNTNKMQISVCFLGSKTTFSFGILIYLLSRKDLVFWQRNSDHSFNAFYIIDGPFNTVLSTTPSNTTVLRGSAVSLNCSTDANPDAHVYQFYFSSGYIGNSSSGVFTVTVDKDGVYTCVPINTASTGHNATVSVTTVGESRNKTILFN